ncbi:hypothetical protein [Nocardia miyunensis]|uniref:hypothetical protein n=1 Tax=Nocardia miyunensis TaxID=282684 RepID=UPI001FE1D90A|nr:hypothetical protein [Nocardia miyunensis]
MGQRLRSAVCGGEIIVVRPPGTPVELWCGGYPMTAPDARVDAATVGAGPGIVLGKRYVDDSTGLEVLCTRAGIGPLVVDGRELTIKAPKALPASD